MDPVWITIAFLFGFAARQIGLPPLVGFLAAGFVLRSMGAVGGDVLQILADLGVTLLLFTIGLKLDVKILLKPEIWAGTSLHMLVTVAVFGGFIYGLGALGFGLFGGLDLKLCLLIAFSLSFSSTVFAVKVLEAKGEMSSLHGRVAIGILIMQDVLAVIFLTASTGKIPSPWAIAVLAALFAIRPLLFKIMDRCGHGELTILFGFFLALVVGAASFESVSLKADLGALVIGMLMAAHPKSKEVAKSLFGFKEIYLVCFFLSIGLSGSPSWQAMGVAFLLTVLIPLKSALFFLLLTRFKLRARSGLLTALNLSNYSEFGLIVCAVGVENNWIGSEWLIIVAMALSLSFVLAAPLNTAANSIYQKLHDRLVVFETEERHPDDQLMDPGPVTLAVFGMGKIGTSAYDYLRERHGDTVVGLDFNEKNVARHRSAGRNVISGDATDPDFWERIRTHKRKQKFSAVILAMPNHKANLFAVRQLQLGEFQGKVAAVAMFEDEVNELKAAGVHAAFNFYAEAGTGFAKHVDENLLLGAK
ncbi:MAG: cation:proton antiporter [Proteobacteria bacterium]|nr:cation:proton antiporter [Pseudomonadota bacterium]MBU0968772.1 cation:proton antiporter [Pseudomonadota bacterium]